MPAITPEIISDISKGNYHHYLETSKFEKFLSEFLDKSKSPLSKDNFLDNLVKKGKLKYIYNFFEAYISKDRQIAKNTVKNLLLVQFDFFSSYLKKHYDSSEYSFTENDSNTINSYFSFISEFYKIPGAIDTETVNNTFRNNKDLLKYIIEMLPNFNPDSITTIQTSRYPFDIIEPLSNFAKTSGNLVSQLKNNGSSYTFIESYMQDLLGATAIPKIQPIQLSRLRNLFLNQYLHGYDDIEKVCLQLFNTTECYPYSTAVNEVFQRISQGQLGTNSTIAEAGNVLNQLMFGSEAVRLKRLTDLSLTEKATRNNRLSNFLVYLGDSLSIANEENQTLSVNFLECMSLLLIDLKYVFEANRSRPKIINKALSLFLKVLGNPSIENGNHSFRIMSVLTACKDEVKNLLETTKKYPSSKDKDINTPIKIFSDILHQINTMDAVISDGSQNIIAIVTELNQACLNLYDCNSSSTTQQLIRNLGTTARRLYKLHKAKEAETIIEAVQAIIKNITGKVSEDELKIVAWEFSSAYHNKEVNKIERTCKELFELSNCHAASNASIGSDVIPTTTTPETITNRTTTLPTTTTSTIPLAINASITTISAINQTGNEVIPIVRLASSSESPSTTEIIQDIAENLASRLPTVTEASAAATHGFGSGLVNLITQATSIFLRSKGYGESKISALSLSLASGILQASCMTTFPVMLFKLNELVAQGNDEEEQAQWEIMTSTMLPTFFTSLGLSTGLQLLNYLSENYLSKQSMIKALIQSIPTISSLWSFTQNPILTGIHTATAYTVSAAGLFGFNRYSNAKNHQSSDLKTTHIDGLEMESFNAEKENVKQTVTTPISETTGKTHQYICLPELNEVKILSQHMLDLLEKLIKTLEKDILAKKNQTNLYKHPSILSTLEKIITDNSHILGIAKPQLSFVKTSYNELNSDIHLQACEMYTAEQKKEFVSAMEKLGNVFKLMETQFKTLQGELKTAIGYTEAANYSFSDDVKQQLNTLKENINFPLSKITLYKDRYSNADAILKTENRCKLETNVEIFNKFASSLSTTTFRENSKRKNNLKDRNTFTPNSHYRSENDLRASTTSSSGESEHSVASGNSVYNPIERQQETPLLDGNSFRV